MGQQKIGEQRICSAVFTSASGTAYTAGDSIGTVQTLTDAGDANNRILTLDSLIIRDSAAQNKGIKFLFFSGSAQTLTDNAAFTFGASTSSLIAVLDIDAADFSTVDSIGLVSRTLLSLRMKLGASTSLYVAAVTTGTPTYGAAGTVSVDFHFSY